ncbi:pyridoxal phosphate-dependent aminotransferase [Nitrogeniibacter mangrovi]|uniref:Aminotransferase n=1 Tax=Nitrogeniibacter mangrovi TaxID=2016596 RepID=A0A6C1B5J2_9RHOO|nr:pyridoxal phosphate-dependent aminotransferase [Nitrogeniibacter mangrovi]QID18982.1 pyridoxal phosphate-dependent aminotransferase [Nitrogeniibacter mangrovi]
MPRTDLPFSRRLHDIEPFHVMELLRRSRELEAAGRDIIHMEVGEPDFGTPEPILEAATRFLATGNVHYTSGLGMPALREAIARFYADRFGLDIAPERIVVTPGASGALMLALAALTDPGDVWLMPDPTYPSNRHLVRAFEGRVRALPSDAAQAYQPTAAQVESAWCDRTRGLMVASPSNPTGTLIAPATLRALADGVRRRGGTLIVDEIYQGLTYGVAASTALAEADDAFVINSFSKYFGMTGWRLGWLVVPDGFAREIERLAQHFFIAASTVAQHAALAAFSPACMAVHEARRAEFSARRNVLLPALEALGFGVGTAPEGAFYIYADIRSLAPDCETLAHRLIEDAGVAATPGIDFGEFRCREHIRFAYTTGIDRLEAAVERIAGVLRG